MIQAINLSKHYGKTIALNQVTLTVPKGAIYALLGPNGSGKSTFLKLLMGFLFPTAGIIQLATATRTQIGYLPERAALPMRFSIEEYLQMMGKLCNLGGDELQQSVPHRLHQVGLLHARERQIATCSKGMLQRLALAASLLGNPALLVLDEPMSGLDPEAQHHIRRLIKEEHHNGTTILLSTHHLADVAELCSHLAIINRGQLRRSGALQDVLPLRNRLTIQVAHWPPEQQALLRSRFPDCTINGNALDLHEQSIHQKPAVLRLLLDQQIDIVGMVQHRASLEELYLEAIQ